MRCTVAGEVLPTYFVYSSVCRVKAFNAIPYYRDNVYDPDPDGIYTKAKLERLKVIPLKLFYYQTFFETWPG